MAGIKEKFLKLDQWMTAITFAEAGERETALEIMGETIQKRTGKRVRARIDKRNDQRPVLRA